MTAAGALCVITDPDPEDRRGARLPCPHEPRERALVCGDHHARLEGNLAELPAIAGWLQVNLARAGAAGEPVSGTLEAPVPIRLGILVLLGPEGHDCGRDGCCTAAGCGRTCRGHHDPAGTGQPSIADVLGAWTQDILERTRLAGPRGYRRLGRGTALDTWCAWLLARLPWAEAQQWIPHFHEDLAILSSRAHALAPWRPPHPEPKPTPCQRCDLRTLIDRGNIRYPIECDLTEGGCGRLYTQAEYDRWTDWCAGYYQHQQAAAS